MLDAYECGAPASTRTWRASLDIGKRDREPHTLFSARFKASNTSQPQNTHNITTTRRGNHARPSSDPGSNRTEQMRFHDGPHNATFRRLIAATLAPLDAEYRRLHASVVRATETR
jgi:hypothetical protein